jgi:hypothetical protein
LLQQVQHDAGIERAAAPRERRLIPMERRIEAGDLRHARRDRRDRADDGELMRLMERCKRYQRLERADDRLIDEHRFGVDVAAVNDPMTDRGETALVADVLREPPLYRRNRGFVAGSFDGFVGAAIGDRSRKAVATCRCRRPVLARASSARRRVRSRRSRT